MWTFAVLCTVLLLRQGTSKTNGTCWMENCGKPTTSIGWRMRYRGRAAWICIPAKDGSTSFWHMMFEALSNRTWPKECAKKNGKRRWCAINKVNDLKIVHSKDRLTGTGSVFKLTMSRNPLRRLVSSFKSKIRCPDCGHTDEGDRRHYVPALSGDKHIRCLSFRDFVEVLYQNRSKPFKTKGSEHWRRQSTHCKLKTIKYNNIVRLETIDKESFWPLFRYLGATLLSFPHLHVEHRRRHRHRRRLNATTHATPQPTPNATTHGTDEDGKGIPKADLPELRTLTKKIYAIYESDYTAYNYTKDLDNDALYIWNFFKRTPRWCMSQKNPNITTI